jgi:acetyl-CoA carboxylase biotin carboxyl carrier protein
MATQVEATLPATVIHVAKATGDVVDAGDVLMILESMKMEIPIEAPVSGTCHILVSEGAGVDDGSVVAIID